MNTQHTPGPWHAAGSYILAQRNPGGTKHHIAEASRDQPSQICLANAQLIAAAPDLYQALAVLLKMVEDGDYTTVELNEAKAALNKAKGNQ